MLNLLHGIWKTLKMNANICTLSKSEPQLAEGRLRTVVRPERDRTVILRCCK